jgi:hypothetical protein
METKRIIIGSIGVLIVCALIYMYNGNTDLIGGLLVGFTIGVVLFKILKG